MMTMDQPPSSRQPHHGSERAKARRTVTIVTILARLAMAAYYVIRLLRELLS